MNYCHSQGCAAVLDGDMLCEQHARELRASPGLPFAAYGALLGADRAPATGAPLIHRPVATMVGDGVELIPLDMWSAPGWDRIRELAAARSEDGAP